MDGNFSAEHLKMPRAEKDVWLTNGEGYMVEKSNYQRHLLEAKDIREVSASAKTVTFVSRILLLEVKMLKPPSN